MSKFSKALQNEFTFELKGGKTFFSLFTLSLLLSAIIGIGIKGLFIEQEILKALFFPLIWSIYVVSGAYALSRFLQRDQLALVLEVYRVYQIPVYIYYISKTVLLIFLISINHLFASTALAMFFNMNIFKYLSWYIPLTILVSMSYCALGVFLASFVSGYKNGDIIYPIIFLPLITPVFLTAIEIATHSLATNSLLSSADWVSFLIALSVAYLIFGILFYDHVVRK